jgi:hypothetical protein
MTLWSQHSILRRGETWLPEWSGNLGGVQRWGRDCLRAASVRQSGELPLSRTRFRPVLDTSPRYLAGWTVCFPPVVELVPSVRPLASRAVALDPLGCTVAVVRPVLSRKVVRPPDSDALRCVRPVASRYVVV